MSTISLILETLPDGNLLVPLPPEVPSGTYRVEVKLEPVEQLPRPIVLGLWKNLPKRLWVSPDFDEPLEDFKDYMP